MRSSEEELEDDYASDDNALEEAGGIEVEYQRVQQTYFKRVMH
jgi:hypothetical protein